MKRLVLSLLALSAPLFTAGYVLAQTGTSKAQAPKAPASASKAAPAAEKPQKLIRVATLTTAQANREFQANVQLLQSQRQAAVELNAAMEKETNAAKKKELKTQFDTLLAKLNENNEKMTKAYGFSLNRNYTLEIESAHIYMLVSEEEAAKIEKEQSAKK